MNTEQREMLIRHDDHEGSVGYRVCDECGDPKAWNVSTIDWQMEGYPNGQEKEQEDDYPYNPLLKSIFHDFIVAALSVLVSPSGQTQALVAAPLAIKLRHGSGLLEV